jgi:hypothetical protein
MAADPDGFEDDCRSDDGILSSGDGDDLEEVQSLSTSIRSTRAEQTNHNTVGNELAVVRSCLPLLNTAHCSLIYSHCLLHL